MSFKGKAIYNPSGKAGEYSKWACNFYVGCPNGCTYCYLKKGRGAKILGGNEAKLKKCFKDEDHAFEVFKKELVQNLHELKKHGLFFSFTTDPMITQTRRLTIKAVHYCNLMGIPVKVLTKQVGYLYLLGMSSEYRLREELIAIGVTLTGDDSKEPNASTTQRRIEALKMAKNSGYKTFVSLEPILTFKLAKELILHTTDFVDLYKIGLESGKDYNVKEAELFVNWLCQRYSLSKYYLKESLQKLIGCKNSELNKKYFVEKDYNIFKQKL
jgi:DNA repair photolyase